jgi:hypothetical protein
MCSSDYSKRLCELERAVLRALCQPSLSHALRKRACEDLATHQWQAEDHRIVFAALQKARDTNVSPLLEQLPAHATRMGFPDIDWAALFEPSQAIQDIDRLICDLKAAKTY